MRHHAMVKWSVMLCLSIGQEMIGAEVTVLDALGRTLRSERVECSEYSLDLGKVPTGVYLLTLRSSNSSVTQRVIRR